MWTSCASGSGRRWAASSTTLARGIVDENGAPPFDSARHAPGMPPQVICYERADDIGFGVSGVVTRARAIRESLPRPRPRADAHDRAGQGGEACSTCWTRSAQPPARRTARRRHDDPHAARFAMPYEDEAVRPALHPAVPQQARRTACCRLGQFNQWVGQQLMGGGAVQIWPGTPVDSATHRGRQGGGRAPRGPGHRPSTETPTPASCPAWTFTPR